MKKILAIILCCIFIVSAAACGSSAPAASTAPAAASEPEAAEETALPDWADNLSDAGKATLTELIGVGKLTIGTSADYPPFEFHTEIDGKDTIIGFDISIAQAIADMIGVELDITDMSFDNLLMSLSKGDFNMVIASMGVSEERQKAVDFTNSYYIPKELIVVRTEDADQYTVPESLAGKTVAAQKGTVLVNNAIKYAGEENVVQLVKVQDEMAELMAGKVDAVLCDDAVAAGYAAVYDELAVVDIGLENGAMPTAIAIQKGDAGMVELVNYILSTFDQSTLDSWLGEAQATAGIED